MTPSPAPTLLDARDLRAGFEVDDGFLRAVDGVALAVREGETLGLVGESGCGKSVTALSLLRLIPQPPGRIESGTALFRERDLLRLPIGELRQVRGRAISLIFQEPQQAFSPLHRIGDQLIEALRFHRPISRAAALALARAGLVRVGIGDPDQRLQAYPHQLSGGQLQRVMIVMALLLEPALIIADEPTTALDVTIQAQIFSLLKAVKTERTALILITHDLGAVWEMCDRVAVMYAARIVETGTVDDIFHRPAHPYTRALLEAIPSLDRPVDRLAVIPGQVPSPLALPTGCRFQDRCPRAMDRCRASYPPDYSTPGGGTVACFLADPESDEPRLHAASTVPEPLPAVPPPSPSAPTAAPSTPLLEIRDLKVAFPLRRGVFSRIAGWIRAVDGVSLDLHAGETLGLVGESGCGKTTLGRAIVGLELPRAGHIRFQGRDWTALSPRDQRAQRPHLQMIFQNPYQSLNPRLTVGEIVTEGLRAHRRLADHERDPIAGRLLAEVGMGDEALHRFPHEFSGGQRQRISIARALALHPQLVVCDEAVSALDVSIRAQILNLLIDLRHRHGLAYLFISHDLSVVRAIAHRVAVMYLGRIVEIGDVAEVLQQPRHPYTRLLRQSVLEPGRPRRPAGIAGGEVPSPSHPPPGCPFHPRCPYAIDRCRIEPPLLQAALPQPHHLTSCHRQDEI